MGKWTWQDVAVVGIGAATLIAIAVWAPEDVRTGLLGADGVIFALVTLYMRSPRDRRPPPAALLVLGLLGALSGCGTGVTALGVASASRTAVCLVCEKLATLGACPTSGGEEEP